MTPEEFGEMKAMIKEIHKAMFGNGQPGMCAEFERAKGAISFIKWVLGPGIFVTFCISAVALAKHLL